ncbi:MAG: hypothetical protein HYY50_01200 [Candidatus Kerfeldbacteria bacterium]|nr:hypothetical protein [Candidatus Kerfeldbacteria bacterium]
MMNRPDQQALVECVAGNGRSSRSDQEVFESKIYRAPDGRIALPRPMLLAVLKNAGREVKLGRQKVTTPESTLLSSLLSIKEEYLTLDGGRPGSEPLVERDSRRAIQRQGRKQERVRAVRPKIKRWGFEVTLCVSSPSQARIARQLFDVAGAEGYLGDFHPSSKFRKKLKANGWKAPFNRFAVTEWAVEAVLEEAMAAV